MTKKNLSCGKRRREERKEGRGNGNTFPPNLKTPKPKLGRHCQNKNCWPELWKTLRVPLIFSSAVAELGVGGYRACGTGIRLQLIKDQARAPPRKLIPEQRCPPARKSPWAMPNTKIGAVVWWEKRGTWALLGLGPLLPNVPS